MGFRAVRFCEDLFRVDLPVFASKILIMSIIPAAICAPDGCQDRDMIRPGRSQISWLDSVLWGFCLNVLNAVCRTSQKSFSTPFCLSRFLWNWIPSSRISNIFTVPSSQPTCHRNICWSQSWKLSEAQHRRPLYWPPAGFPGCCSWWSRWVLHKPPCCTAASASPGHTLLSLHSDQHWTDAPWPNREPRWLCRSAQGSPERRNERRPNGEFLWCSDKTSNRINKDRGAYLLLKVVVSKVENLHRAVTSSHSQPLCAAIERHGPDGAGHVVKEADTVHHELPHWTLRRETKWRLRGGMENIQTAVRSCRPGELSGSSEQVFAEMMKTEMFACNLERPWTQKKVFSSSFGNILFI